LNGIYVKVSLSARDISSKDERKGELTGADIDLFLEFKLDRVDLTSAACRRL
jgi:hypothetical protein